MKAARFIHCAVILVMVLTLFLASASSQPAALAQQETPEPTDREMSIKVDFTWYDWYVARWADNYVGCRVLVEHEGVPTEGEIKAQCITEVYQDWKNTPPCALAETGQETSCAGYYLHFVRSFAGQRDVVVTLPKPAVYLTISGCNEEPYLNRCSSVPNIVLTGEEQLPNEQVIRIQGTLDGVPFSCAGETCTLPLNPTGSQGSTLEFWGDSSFGDSSDRYTAMIRVQPWGDFMAPEGNKFSGSQLWYVDIISSQWRGGNTPSCSETWSVFPEIGGPPAWLSTSADLASLESSTNYYYLAGLLISKGAVDASTCPGGGLSDENTANQCGLEAALPLVNDWQNQFDESILAVSNDTGIPAQLLKNIFSRESQFWPGTYDTYKEAGLGHLTEEGADTVLLWNPDFFAQFCPLVLSQETCDLGFGNLKEEYQTLLRGALVHKVNATCPECPVGVDLTTADYSINIFAQSLLANCEQTGRAISNITNRTPGQVSSYVDLWKFTLVNYNAGIGCLSTAFERVWNAGQNLTWENVSSQLEPVCQSAISYVNDVSESPLATPTATPWVRLATLPPSTPLPTQQIRTPQFTPLPGTKTPTPQAGGTQPVATQTPYPAETGYPYPVETPIYYPTTTPYSYDYP